jgi:hypothetical protein
MNTPSHHLIGKTITAIEYERDAEYGELNTRIAFNDGTTAYLTQDVEWNPGGGCLHIIAPNGRSGIVGQEFHEPCDLWTSKAAAGDEPGDAKTSLQFSTD